ncbi:hypothetical protein V8E54_014048 [Elaphomyces granulatus]
MALFTVDWNNARRWLVALTDDLKAGPMTSPDALLAARKDIAIALMDGQLDENLFEHRFIYNPGLISLTPARWALYDAAIPTAVPTAGQRVVRRTVGLPSKAVNMDNFPESKMFGRKASLTHGPFLDSLDREVYFDVFKPSPVQAFAFPGGSPEYLYTTAPVTNSGRFTADLGKGTVWIRADLFTRNNPIETQAPPDIYFGLAIESGTETTPPVSTVPRTLALKLAGGTTSSATFSITPVTDVSFSFIVSDSNIVTATITSIGNGGATVLGSVFNMQQSSNNATYDFSMGRMNFAMKTDNSTFQPMSQSSQLVESTGMSQVGAVAWSVLAKNSENTKFYEMPSPGGFAVSLIGSSTIGVRGDDLPVSLDASTLIVDPGSVVITGLGGKMPTRSRTVAVGKPSVGSTKNKSSVTFQPHRLTRFYYKATANGAESWTILMDIALALDQPRTVNNDRVPIACQNGGDNPWSTLTWFHDPASSGLTLNIQAINTLQARDPIAYALRNLLVKADLPGTIDMSSRYESGVLVSGTVTMVSFLRYTLPFLPDPYVSNFELIPDASTEKNGMGYLTISYQLGEETTDEMNVSIMTRLAIPAKTVERNTGDVTDDFALGTIRSPFNKYWGEREDFSFRQQEVVSGIVPDLGVGQLVHAPDGILSSPIEGQIFHPPTLLDMSSSSSQFGVVFGTGFNIGQTRDTFLPFNSPTSFAPVEEFGISGLMLESTASNVRVMALPAVQWETVLDDKPPNEVYTFPYSGPSTQIAIQDGARPAPSVRLVPVAPREAIDGLVGSFNSTAQVSIAARSSLPFGMVALAKMSNQLSFPQTAAQVNKIEFTFGGEEDPRTKLKTPKLQPAHQLWFGPPDRLRLINPHPGPPQPGPPLKLVGAEDLSFSGRTIVLAMGVGPLISPPPPPAPPPPPGSRADLLDPATTTFNKDMKTKVPLLRFDISGYGSTIFSDWKRVLGAGEDQTAITHVLMNVLAGRTSCEVIEIQTVMAPFAVTVRKQIEIRRLNSGVVIRHEGEWQAASVGRYFYQNTGIVTHPGIIRGVTDVRNIADVSGTTRLNNVPLLVREVRFDCNVEIEDGGAIRSISGVQLDGCVFLPGDNGEDLSDPGNGPIWYSSTLDQLELGGHIDAIVQIGKSGQKKRLTSIAVKSSVDPASGKPIAVVAAMGSPIFPGGGQWSFARIQGGDASKQPQPVDLAKGVPLVKNGPHDSPNLSLLTTPYQFRDPQDLLSSFPFTTYNIIHGAASHRVLFAGPEIPFVQDAQKAGFEVTQVWVADSLALGKSASIFPSLGVCLPGFPGLPTDPKQVLEIVKDAGYKFEIPHLQLPDAERLIKDDAAVQTVAQAIKDGTGLADNGKQLAADVLAAQTTLSVAIDTVTNISKMDVTNLHMVTKTVDATTAAVKDASRTIGRLSSDVQKIGGLLGADPDAPDLPGVPKAVEEVKHVFGSALEQVQKAISFLENLKFLPHFKVSMTNEWAMVISTSMNKDDLLAKMQSPTKEAVGRIIESFDFLISATISLASFLLKMHIATTIKIPTGVGPIVALGTGAFDVALGTAGVQVELELGFGIGVDLSVGPFSASASYIQSQSILVTAGVFGLGITAVMHAHVDLVVASADLYLEAKLLVVGGICHPPLPAKHEDHGGTTIWAYARVKIALHVSIFLVCNIGYEEEAHWDSDLNGGGCLLDYMTDLTH